MIGEWRSWRVWRKWILKAAVESVSGELVHRGRIALELVVRQRDEDGSIRVDTQFRWYDFETSSESEFVKTSAISDDVAPEELPPSILFTPTGEKWVLGHELTRRAPVARK